MSDDTREQSVKAYFDGIAAKNMSRVPWAKDATAAYATKSRRRGERSDPRTQIDP
jgi:hypothetical protein